MSKKEICQRSEDFDFLEQYSNLITMLITQKIQDSSFSYVEMFEYVQEYFPDMEITLLINILVQCINRLMEKGIIFEYEERYYPKLN